MKHQIERMRRNVARVRRILNEADARLNEADQAYDNGREWLATDLYGEAAWTMAKIFDIDWSE